MIFYHIDRYNNLKSGDVLELITDNLPDYIHPNLALAMFPDGLSQHGITYLSDYRRPMDKIMVNLGDENYHTMMLPEQLVEASKSIGSLEQDLILELVRRAHFPSMPSRLQCLFALASLEDVTDWPELQSDKTHLFKIESSVAHKFDSTHLRGGLTIRDAIYNEDNISNLSVLEVSLSPSLTLESAYKYWGQELSERPRMEYLLPLPVEVGPEVPMPSGFQNP